MTWYQCQAFFVLIAGVTLMVALSFAVLGFWPILPFAGMELGLLWVALWLSAASGQNTEVVSIGRHTIAVDRGAAKPERIWETSIASVRVTLRESSNSWYPSTLVLVSMQKELQLGDFLNEEERRELAKQLMGLLTQSGLSQSDAQ